MIISTEVGCLRERVGEKRAIEMLAKAGFQALDYTFTPWMERGEMPWTGDNYIQYGKEVKKIADDNGVFFNQAHAPFVFHTSCLSDWNKEILPMQIRCMESCALLGIPHMVVHSIHHVPYVENKKYLWDLNSEYFNLLLPYAKDFGVKLCLENLYAHDERRGILNLDFLSQPSEYNAFYDSLNDPYFICCVDTGHCSITNENAGDMIRQMGSRVKALHLNDNTYRGDDHLIPGHGLIDFDDVMKALAEIGYTGDLTFEALNVYRAYDDEFLPVAAKFLYDVGEFLARRFDYYSAQMK